MNNCNKDITTRVYKKEDLYDGMFIQSFGNEDYIYKITINDDKYYYSTSHRIFKYTFKTRDNDIHFPKNPVDIEDITGSPSIINYFKEDSDGYITWCETFWTRKLNKDTKREDILIELGI